MWARWKLENLFLEPTLEKIAEEPHGAEYKNWTQTEHPYQFRGIFWFVHFSVKTKKTQNVWRWSCCLSCWQRCVFFKDYLENFFKISTQRIYKVFVIWRICDFTSGIRIICILGVKPNKWFPNFKIIFNNFKK